MIYIILGCFSSLKFPNIWNIGQWSCYFLLYEENDYLKSILMYASCWWLDNYVSWVIGLDMGVYWLLDMDIHAYIFFVWCANTCIAKYVRNLCLCSILDLGVIWTCMPRNCIHSLFKLYPHKKLLLCTYVNAQNCLKVLHKCTISFICIF